jgi:tripartite-type tricarboxylate transporter receptor subunit TctC
LAPSGGRADDYPSRPIHLIVTSPAGSLVDVLGRLVAEGSASGSVSRLSSTIALAA